MKITRVSNAGILVENQNKNYLIDAFNTAEVHPYFATDPVIYHELMDAEDENFLVFTHAHPDHFNAVMTMEYLSHHPSTRVIGPEPVLEKLRMCGIDASRMIAAEDLTFGTNREIYAFRTMHIGAPYRHVIHYSYFINEKQSLLFTGDATPVMKNYEDFHAYFPHFSVLVSNYSHILGVGTRTIDQIQPDHTVVVHLPDPLEDEMHLIQMAEEAQMHSALDITLLDLCSCVSF